MDPDVRKERLGAARRALFSRDPKVVEAALRGLPPSGDKASTLRDKLLDRLLGLKNGSTASQPSLGMAIQERVPVAKPHAPAPQKANAGSARIVETGTRHQFYVGDLDSTAPFGVRVVGANVSIILNCDHPAFGALAAPEAVHASHHQPVDHLVRPGVRELLLAWSRLELGAGESAQRDRIRRIREDLGYALADVVDDTGGAQ
jgi:hypothetical protein